VTVRSIVVDERPSAALAEVADERGADLIVVGVGVAWAALPR
jgi:nucleotide-binding universal stress UspA family protein